MGGTQIAAKTKVTAPPKNLGTRYVVRKGDTLYKLSQRQYHNGNHWREVVAHNSKRAVMRNTHSKIPVTGKIFVGQVIYFPELQPVPTAQVAKPSTGTFDPQQLQSSADALACYPEDAAQNMSIDPAQVSQLPESATAAPPAEAGKKKTTVVNP